MNNKEKLTVGSSASSGRKPIQPTAEEQRLSADRAAGRITNRQYTDGLECARREQTGDPLPAPTRKR